MPKAGEEEGIAEDGGAGSRFRNTGAGVLSMVQVDALVLSIGHDMY